MPVKKFENGSWLHPARLPLGAGWSGHCTAPGHEGDIPEQHVLEAFCNLGYASSCSWAPRDRPWDAVRFSVCAPPDSAVGEPEGDAAVLHARVLRVRYVCEKNHLPADNGNLEFDLSRSAWLRSHDDPRLQRMAECFLDFYLKKKA
jgi:hypothetical protein